MLNNTHITKQKVFIPERNGAPETNLYVKTLSKPTTDAQRRPTVMVLPGGPGMDHRLYQTYSCLMDYADIVYHDPRGCGQSDKSNPLTYTMDNYIEDVEAIRHALNIEKVIVLGKSYGSVCATGYALRYQQHIEKLILSAGAPSYHSLYTAKENLSQFGTPAQIKLFDKLWNGEFKSNVDLAEFFVATAPLYSHHLMTKLESYALAYFAMNFSYESMNLGFSDFLKRFDFTDDLHRIACDTLIVAGADDWINDVRHMKVLAEKIPNNAFHVLSDCGHSMESDAKDVYFDIVKAFLRKDS